MKFKTKIYFHFKILISFLSHLRWIAIGLRVENMFISIVEMSMKYFLMQIVKKSVLKTFKWLPLISREQSNSWRKHRGVTRLSLFFFFNEHLGLYMCLIMRCIMFFNWKHIKMILFYIFYINISKQLKNI
jgi:hypothetical protein